MFSESGQKYGWVASVGIPRCAPDVPRQRAEEIIEAAINLLKVFIGLRYSRPMRLPIAPCKMAEPVPVLTEVDRQMTWTWHGASLDGALVVGNPLTWCRPAWSILPRASCRKAKAETGMKRRTGSSML